MPLKIVVFASGQGSNAKAIDQAIQEGRLDAQIQCLVCNSADAPVISWAQSRAPVFPTLVIPHQGLTRAAHEAQILAQLNAFEIDYIVLAGYMRLFTPSFLHAFEKERIYRIVNIHPSLLPAFPGANAYEDAFHYGVKVSGITVHLVDEVMDHGAILLQASFERHEEDTLDSFKARGLALEHKLYPNALQLLAEDRVKITVSSPMQRPNVEIKTHASC